MARTADNQWPDWVQWQLVRRGIRDRRVLQVMTEVDRGDFLPLEKQKLALEDAPIPIGCGQTVSQPYVIALSLAALRLEGTERVLDVGTGSGYQAALLSRLAREVYTIELHQRLYTEGRMNLQRFGKGAVHTRHADGSRGWEEAAPFDGIVAGCFAEAIPDALLAQLAPGGRLVMPVGASRRQSLILVEKSAEGALRRSTLEQVVFVPLLGGKGNPPAVGR